MRELGCSGGGAADRLCQCRRSADRSRRRACAGVRHAARAGRRPRRDRSSTADRERGARAVRRRAGHRDWVRRLAGVRVFARRRVRRHGTVDARRPHSGHHRGDCARDERRLRPSARCAVGTRQPPRDARRVGQRVDRRRGPDVAAARDGRCGSGDGSRAARGRGTADSDARPSAAPAGRVRRHARDDSDALARRRALSHRRTGESTVRRRP